MKVLHVIRNPNGESTKEDKKKTDFRKERIYIHNNPNVENDCGETGVFGELTECAYFVRVMLVENSNKKP